MTAAKTEPISLSMLRAVRRASSLDDLLGDLASQVSKAAKVDGCEILLRDPGDGLVLAASTWVPEYVHRMRLGKGLGIAGAALLAAEPVFLPSHAGQDPRFLPYPGIEEHTDDALAVIPLQIDKEPPFGVIVFRKQEAWPLPAARRQALQMLASEVAEACTAFRNAYQTGAVTSRLGQVTEVTRTIASSPYLEEILQLLVNLTAQRFNYKVCTVRLLDEARHELVLRATQAQDKAYQRKRAIKLGESIAGRAIDENRPIIVPDVQAEEDYIGHDLAAEQGLRSMICVPLVFRDRPLGVLSCYTSEVRDFPPDEVGALETLAKQAAVSIEHAKLQVRDTLMQEVHHRVKNNLQQVASLLRLQVRHSQYKSLEEALNDTLARILAIAAVHDLLSREDLDHVDIGSIGESLIQHQQSSLILPDRKIHFEVRGDEVRLNMMQATQLALVLNELILNAVEHGFKRTVEGEVHVTVEQHDDEVALWVANSGDRLPEGFDSETSSHLGLQIVANLTRSMGGKFSLRDILGWTVAEVKFPRASAE